jgi:hypothetical protein
LPFKPLKDNSYCYLTRTHTAPHKKLMRGDHGIGDQRYSWRCAIISLFGRRFRPDAEMAKQARDFAYAKRRMIHASFDAGRTKQDRID